jgi:hypothetical protein
MDEETPVSDTPTLSDDRPLRVAGEAGPPDSPVRPQYGEDLAKFPRLDKHKAPTESNPLPVIVRLLEEGQVQIEISGKEPFSEELKHGGKKYRLEGKYAYEPDGPMVVYRFVGNDIPGEVTPENAPAAEPEEREDITMPMPMEPTAAEGVFDNPQNLTPGVTELPLADRDAELSKAELQPDPLSQAGRTAQDDERDEDHDAAVAEQVAKAAAEREENAKRLHLDGPEG